MRPSAPSGLVLLAFTASALTAFDISAQATPAAQTTQMAPSPITTADLAAFQPRSIGPAVTGGRIHDVEALPDDPSTVYVATASGGLWKSTNRGHTWTDLWADMPTSTFGDLAISPSDPDVIYAGTGEQNNRQSTSWGNGVYRSDDAGQTWRHLGLEETRHTGRIAVHPTNPDVVWVAAQGNLWSASPDRGVYMSSDGGGTWNKTLFVDDDTGATDLVVDPANPDVVYAATYQRRRRTWGFNGGGPGSGIHKSTDGGRTWTRLGRGLPTGDLGRIGLAISESQPQILNALVQHASESGMYRTEDGGASWERVNTRNGRPMYYSHIFIDPTDPDRVYTLGTNSYTSPDGGRTQTDMSARPTYDVGLHADHHTMWIDPADPEHFYLAGDAGLHETYDGGQTYRRINNLPIGQFYGIGVDMRTPYRVYGGMQDNHSWMGPSETRRWIGIVNDDWQQIGFGDGMFQQIDPTNHRYVYSNSQSGNYTRVDSETGDILDIRPLPPVGSDEVYRFDWASPSLVSRHDPATIYTAGNRFFISPDRGDTWARSEDLTRAVDRDGLELMGVRGEDMELSPNDGTSSYGEIVSIAESPLTPDVLWVGTDDGVVQMSQDAGATWTDVTDALVTALRAVVSANGTTGAADRAVGAHGSTYVSRVVASARGEAVAYVSLDAHRDGDFSPYVFRTEDRGRTWTPVHDGLPSGSVNVIVEHPDNPDVMFAGTEHGVFVSTDNAANWAQMPNLPTTAHDDLVIHPREKDLVMGTHGRSIWILDDTRPLAEWSQSQGQPAHLFSIPATPIMLYWKDTSYRGPEAYAGTNPRDGVELTYRLASRASDAVLTIHNRAGETIRRFNVPSQEGVHRLNWDLRHGLADESTDWQGHDDAALARPTDRRGPLVSPGLYRITLTAGDAASSTWAEVLPDPDAPEITLAHYRDREEFLLSLLEFQEELGPANQNEEGSDAVQDIRREVGRLYGSIAGSGVRQGSLHAPTRTHRERLESLRRAFQEARGG